jgi:Zn-dependent protease with chaperone function
MDGLVVGVSVAAVSGVLLFVVARTRARAIEAAQGEQQAHELRVFLKRWSPVAAGCGGGSAALGAELTRWTGIGTGAAVAAILVACVCVAFPVLAVRRPVMAAYCRVRGVPAGAFRSARQRASLAILLALMLWPIAVALAVGSGVAVGAGFLLIGYLVISPVLFGLLAPVLARVLGADAVSDEFQGRLSRLADQAGVRVRGRIIRARTRKVANAAQVGWLPGMCYVMITDYLLDGMTPAEADAVLAHELGHCRHRDGPTRLLIRNALFLPFVLVLAALRDHGSTVYIVCMSALAIASFIGGRRLSGTLAIRGEIKADDLAVRIVGPAALAAALTRVTELNAIKPDTSRSWDRTVGHPGMAARIARLQAIAAPAAAGQQP